MILIFFLAVIFNFFRFDLKIYVDDLSPYALWTQNRKHIKSSHVNPAAGHGRHEKKLWACKNKHQNNEHNIQTRSNLLHRIENDLKPKKVMIQINQNQIDQLLELIQTPEEKETIKKLLQELQKTSPDDPGKSGGDMHKKSIAKKALAIITKIAVEMGKHKVIESIFDAFD